MNAGTMVTVDDDGDDDGDDIVESDVESDVDNDGDSAEEALLIEDIETAAFKDAEAVNRVLDDNDMLYTSYTHNFHVHAEGAAMRYELPDDEDELDDMCPNGCGYTGNDIDEHVIKCVAFKCTLCHVNAIGPIFGTTPDEQAKSVVYLQWNEHHNIVCPIAADNLVARRHGKPKRQSDRGWRKSNKKRCIGDVSQSAYHTVEGH